jgi:hypothetical protein
VQLKHQLNIRLLDFQTTLDLHSADRRLGNSVIRHVVRVST